MRFAKNHEKKSIGNFRIGQVIGSGTFGKVREGVHTPTGEKVAIKMLEKNKIKTFKDIERIRKQLQILKHINHPNILKLLEVQQTDKYIFIITELIEGEQLYNRIVKKGKLPLNEACNYFCQLLQAVKFLHSKKIAHRDIKPENIIVNDNCLKLIDFGLSTEWTPSKNMMQTPCGSPCYAAPQMVHGKSYDCRKIDIWAMGVTLYAMIMGKLPFQHDNTLQLYRLIQASQLEEIKGVSSSVNILLRSMIQKNPKLRIQINQIQSNIWLQDTLKQLNKKQTQKSEWNSKILKQMENVFKQSSEKIIKKLKSHPISSLSTFYYLKLIHWQNNSINDLTDEQMHEGPFHIQFVFKNIELIQSYLTKNSIDYQWVDEKGKPVDFFDYLLEPAQVNIKKYLLINSEVLTIKKLKNLPKLLYFPFKIATQGQGKKTKQNKYSRFDLRQNDFNQCYSPQIKSTRQQIDKMQIQTF